MLSKLLYPALIVAAAAIVYSNTLQNGFHLDDYYRVKDNPGIQSIWPAWRHFVEPRTMSALEKIEQYRPLLPLTLSVNFYLHGERLAGYHLANIALQAGAALLIFFLALEILTHWMKGERDAPRAAFFAALIFALHPVSGVAVNYISARDMLLMEFFFAAALLAYVRMRRLGATLFRWAAVMLLAALSVLSKTDAAMFAAVAFIFEVTLNARSPRERQPYLLAALCALPAVVCFAFTACILGFSDFEHAVDPGKGRLHYLFLQGAAHLYYLRNFVWPFSMRQLPRLDAVGPIFAAAAWCGLALAAAVLLFALRSRRRLPLVSFCLLSYAALILPTSSVLPMIRDAADYRPYPGSPFLYLALIWSLGRLLPARAFAAACAVLCLYVGGASFSINRVWRTEESLWTHSVALGGDATAHMNLAASIADLRDPRVEANFREALRLEPRYAVAHLNLGLLLVRLGRVREGIESCRRGAEISPAAAQVRFEASRCLGLAGQWQESYGHALQAARLDPASARYRFAAAALAEEMGDVEAALREDRPRHRGHRDEQQQEQRRTHAGELTPHPPRHPDRAERRRLPSALPPSPRNRRPLAGGGLAQQRRRGSRRGGR